MYLQQIFNEHTLVLSISSCSRGYHTLIFAITALYFLMDSLLDFSFQNSSSCRLVKPGRFQNMCRIDPIISPSSHHTITVDLELVHRDLSEMI